MTIQLFDGIQHHSQTDAFTKSANVEGYRPTVKADNPIKKSHTLTEPVPNVDHENEEILDNRIERLRAQIQKLESGSKEKRISYDQLQALAQEAELLNEGQLTASQLSHLLGLLLPLAISQIAWTQDVEHNVAFRISRSCVKAALQSRQKASNEAILPNKTSGQMPVGKVEEILIQNGLRNPDAETRKMTLELIRVSRLDTTSIQDESITILPLRHFVGPLVKMLDDPEASTRVCACDTIKAVFPSVSYQGKKELALEMLNQNIRGPLTREIQRAIGFIEAKPSLAMGGGNASSQRSQSAVLHRRDASRQSHEILTGSRPVRDPPAEKLAERNRTSTRSAGVDATMRKSGHSKSASADLSKALPFAPQAMSTMEHGCSSVVQRPPNSTRRAFSSSLGKLGQPAQRITAPSKNESTTSANAFRPSVKPTLVNRNRGVEAATDGSRVGISGSTQHKNDTPGLEPAGEVLMISNRSEESSDTALNMSDKVTVSENGSLDQTDSELVQNELQESEDQGPEATSQDRGEEAATTSHPALMQPAQDEQTFPRSEAQHISMDVPDASDVDLESLAHESTISTTESIFHEADIMTETHPETPSTPQEMLTDSVDDALTDALNDLTITAKDVSLNDIVTGADSHNTSQTQSKIDTFREPIEPVSISSTTTLSVEPNVHIQTPGAMSSEPPCVQHFQTEMTEVPGHTTTVLSSTSPAISTVLDSRSNESRVQHSKLPKEVSDKVAIIAGASEPEQKCPSPSAAFVAARRKEMKKLRQQAKSQSNITVDQDLFLFEKGSRTAQVQQETKTTDRDEVGLIQSSENGANHNTFSSKTTRDTSTELHDVPAQQPSVRRSSSKSRVLSLQEHTTEDPGKPVNPKAHRRSAKDRPDNVQRSVDASQVPSASESQWNVFKQPTTNDMLPFSKHARSISNTESASSMITINLKSQYLHSTEANIFQHDTPLQPIMGPNGKRSATAPYVFPAAVRGESIAVGLSHNTHHGNPPKPPVIQLDRELPSAEGLKAARVNSSSELESKFQDNMKWFEGRESEENWTPREKFVILVRAMLHGNVHKEYPDALERNVNSFAENIVKAANSLRTTLASHSCNLISDLAIAFGPRLSHNTIGVFALHLAKMAAFTKKIVASLSQVGLRNIIIYCKYQARTAELVISMLTDKNVQTRTYGMEQLHILLQYHTPDGSSADGLVHGIKKCLSDSAPSVREAARKAFRAFELKYPDKANTLIQSLDPQARKRL